MAAGLRALFLVLLIFIFLPGTKMKKERERGKV
jgi:hypothetical protein